MAKTPKKSPKSSGNPIPTINLANPSSEYSHVVTTKLKLTKHSKDSDKRRKKREKKKEKLRLKEEEARYVQEMKLRNMSTDQMGINASGSGGGEAKVPERRRFENQSGRRDKKKTLAQHLTKQQLNQMEVKKGREVEELIKEAQFTYKDRQDKYNKMAQCVTETNEMPPLVMTKIQ